MADRVEIPSTNLTQVIERLTEKRIVLEKAVNTLGEAPSGLRDVFELCRGFERAFSGIINDGPSASKIKEAFFADKGLAGNVNKLPLEKVFEIYNVKKVCRVADGYQPHMVSPEKGLRALASEALKLVEDPVKECIAAVHQLLLMAAREAASIAGENTEAALAGRVPLKVPAFKDFIMPAVTKALYEWQLEGQRMAFMLVEMERTYITAGFFRYTMNRRFQKGQSQAVVARAITKSKFGGLGGLGGRKDKEADAVDGPKGAAEAASSKGVSRDNSFKQGAQGINLSSLSDPGDYIAAYFDKKVNEDSARTTLPVDSWRWQKRFFIYSDSQKTLYYFKSPDDVPKPTGLRGQIYMPDCYIEDLDERGHPRPFAVRASTEMERGEKGSTLLRVRHKDPRQAAVKDHNSIVLRAENVPQKYEWMSRLATAAAVGSGAAAKGAAKDVAADEKSRLSRDSTPAAAAADPAASPNGHAATAADDSDDSDEGPDPFDTTTAIPIERRSSFELISETRLGEGAKFFRAEEHRDADGKLLPAPTVVLSAEPGAASRGLGPAASVQETWEGRYDQLLEQFAGDMSIYIRMVCDTIVTTVPKGVVHCLVRKSEKNILNHMFNYVHKMSEIELKRMLAEDEETIQKRVQVKRLFEDIKIAISDVQYIMDKLARSDERGEKVGMRAEVLAMAGLTEFLTKEQRAKHAALIHNQHLPQIRAPVPLSHMNRPKKLPTAPTFTDNGAAAGPTGSGAAPGAAPTRPPPPAASVSGGDLSRVSVNPRRAAPAVPGAKPDGTSLKDMGRTTSKRGSSGGGGASANGQRTPPLPPGK